VEKYYLNSTFSLPILDTGSCKSQSVVYCIVCIKCNTNYIGETKHLVKTRIMEHINEIKNQLKFLYISIKTLMIMKKILNL
jgi:hypothetical protein